MSLLTNLVSAWELDEASGNAVDSHGTDTLTETSGTIGASTGPGGVGGSRVFAAADTEWFTKADNANFSTGDIDFTIEAWVYAANLSASRDIVSKWGLASNNEFVLLYSASANRFSFFVSHNGTAATTCPATGAGAPSTSTWYHIIAWHDSVNNQLGIVVNDGTPDTVSHTTGVYDGGSAFGIGARHGNTGHWDGRIAKVRRWNKVLTSGEITSLYNSGNGLAYSSFGGGGGLSIPIAAYHYNHHLTSMA